MNVLNRGFGGAHIKHINRHFDSIVLPYEPKAIIFFCGTNDIAAYNPVEKVKLDFEIFYNRMKRDLPNTKLFVIEIQPSPSRFFKEIYNLNGMIILKTLLKLIQIFLWLMYLKLCLQKMENLEESFTSLICCMNQRGYAIWTGKVRDILSEHYPIEMGKELPCERLFGCPRELSPLDLEPSIEEISEDLKI